MGSSNTSENANGICIVERTNVAGTRHAAGAAQRATELAEHEALLLKRCPENYFDPWAVEVRDKGGLRLGYVSCDVNEIVSRLLDGGKRVEGRFLGTNKQGNWTRIEMGVYLYD